MNRPLSARLELVRRPELSTTRTQLHRYLLMMLCMAGASQACGAEPSAPPAPHAMASAGSPAANTTSAAAPRMGQIPTTQPVRPLARQAHPQ
jgi:hypothetical protein